MPKYKQLAGVRRPGDYDALYWARIRTLYCGARDLREVLRAGGPVREDLFPAHRGEDQEVYAERCRRAFYVNYLSEIVDGSILGTLFSDPVTVTAGGEGEDDDPGSVDDYYQAFLRNCARPGARPQTFNSLLREVALDALLFKRAWVLVDFPAPPTDVPVESRAEQEALALDRAYLVRVDPECVVDWEWADDGDLLYAIRRDRDARRMSIEQDRSFVTECYTVFYRDRWERFSWTWDSSKRNAPEDDAEPTETAGGPHSFRRVPLLPFEVSDGLWAGGKLEGIAVEIFNKYSALSWSQYRSLFQMIVIGLASPGVEGTLSSVEEDEKRSVNQPVGPGRVLTLSANDTAKYLSPDAAPFTEARAYLRDLRDEMHRSLLQMAHSVDNTAASAGRSGKSKQMDHSASVVVARDLGRTFREATVAIMSIVATGRGDEGKEWVANGLDDFTEASGGEVIGEAVQLETVSIPSTTFQVAYKADLARKLMPGLSDEQIEEITEELRANLSAEELASQTARDATVATYAEPDGDESYEEKREESDGDELPSSKGDDDGKR